MSRVTVVNEVVRVAVSGGRGAAGAGVPVSPYWAALLEQTDGQGAMRFVVASWYKTDVNTWNEALTAAEAAAGPGGWVVIDAAVTLSGAYDGGTGRVLRFMGGSLAPAAAPFVWRGDVHAPLAEVFTGANRDRVWLTRVCERAHPEWWGAAADGVTDDYVALAAALKARRAGGRICFWSETPYAFGTTLEIGDGTDSMRSTIHNGLILEGVVAGVGAGESGEPNILTSLKWIGATGAAVAMTRMLGGLHSPKVLNLIFDCNGKAGTAGKWTHLYREEIRNVYAENWCVDGWAWDFDVRDSAAYLFAEGVGYAAGFTQGAMEAIYEFFGCRTPPAGRAHGLKLTAGLTAGTGFSRKTFRQCQFIRGSTADSVSIRYVGIDNCSFDDVLTAGTGATPGVGYALQRVTVPAYASFPTENVWKASRLVGDIRTLTYASVDTGTPVDSTIGGHDVVMGYAALGDQAVLDMPFGMHVITSDGRMLGGFAGAAVQISGVVDPDVALSTTSTQYVPLSGGKPTAFASDAGEPMTCGGRFKTIRPNLKTAPGVGNSRTVALLRNGSPTSFTKTWSGTESGDGPVFSVDEHSGGDLYCWRWTLTGSPPASQAAMAAYFYPEEVF